MNPIDVAVVGSAGSAGSVAGLELMLVALFAALVTLALGRKEPRHRR